MTLTRLALALLLLVSAAAGLRAEATNDPFPAASNTASADLLRASLQMQAQLQATQLALERNRQDAEAAATRSAGLLDTRLRLLEQALVGERARELDSLERSQHLMLIFAGVFAGVGLLAVLLTAYMQWRSAERLAGLGAVPPAWSALTHAPPLVSLPSSTGQPVPLGATESANARLLGVVERLEQRIQELEQTARPAVAAPSVLAAHLTPAPPVGAQSAEELAKAEVPRRIAQIELLLRKGQMLLELDRAEEALACFDEALALDPRHMEALVKKGAALEQARKTEEAIACYDRAIATDQSFTMAYLQKGGLFNRLERYEDALKCYEEALRTQERSGAAE